MDESDGKNESKKGNLFAKIIKVCGWTVFSVVAIGCILLFCAVKFIESDRLAPMIEEIANDYVDGQVKLGKIKLGFHPHFPILGVEIENLSVISHAFDSLPADKRGLLPNYADSLLTLDYLEGSVDIKRLIVGNELSLHDVVLRGLGVNLVIAQNGKANYDIIALHADTADTSKKKMPGFRINRFALEHPKEIRFYNAADATSASVLLLTDAALDGNEQPTYRLKINGNVTSPKATLITNLDKISFGVNGKVYWNPSEPGVVAMDEMELRGAFIRAVVAGEIDLTESPIIRKGSVELKPVAISDLLTILPDSIRREHGLYDPYFSTDATIGGRLELLQPMNLAMDTLPAAKINIAIPTSALNYGKAHLKDITLEAAINTEINLPDKTTVDLQQLTVAGPGTQLKASAFVATPISDPSFDANIEGKVDFRDLPPIVLEKIAGYLSGVVTADLNAKGSVSMFKPEHLHRLVADGSVTAKDVYFLSADTSKMVEIGNARIDLDSKRIVDNMPLLKTKIAVDTATILVSGVDLALGSISLDAGMDTSGRNRGDSARMVPISGDLKVGRFNIISITDSAGAKIRNIGGTVSLKGTKRSGNIPEIIASLNIGNVSAGSLSDRVIMRDTKVNASLYKTSAAAKTKQAVKKKRAAHREYSYIAPKDVYKYVYYTRKHRKRTRRVYGDVGAQDEEVLVWNLTPQFRRFLNEWKIGGSVNTSNASLLTPLFPLHTRISTVALTFDNDSVNISNISVEAGRSDITMSGLISNVRRALTAGVKNDLKGNLSLLSDTIDINELAASVFTGASYVSDRKHGKIKKLTADDDATLQSKLNALSKKGPGRSSPVLIPVNIDANLRLDARHLLYSDVDLLNMGGDFLIYDGGISIHDMKTNSDVGNLSLSALYSAPKATDMRFGFGLDVKDFNIAKFVKLVPAIDSITPLMHDFSGYIGADIAATCRIDSGMNISLPSLNAAIKITGDNLAFIDPEKYRTLGKWLGFKNKADNTIHSLNVEMTVADGLMRVYPFAFDIDRYRLGIYGYNNLDMDFDYHLSVLKSPIPFKFGITVKGNPKKYKVRFGGAKFNENTVVESTDIVNNARINLVDQIENVFKRGVRNSQFAKLQIAMPAGFDALPEAGLSAEDSLRLIKEGVLQPDAVGEGSGVNSSDRRAFGKRSGDKKKDKKKKKRWWIF
ncbi:MAG: AsmA-like C-terminal region-containing protein [Muribaculaceae bacterium]|nr:AsmA-like C-terminal region-containing protein [Muribaculaceae bacterium]